MTPIRTTGIPVLLAAAACLAAAVVPARADGASWTSLSAKDGGESLDQVTVKGTIADAASLPEGVSVTLRFGEHAQTLPAGDLVRTTKKITWKAAPGATGVQSFTLKLESGKFTAKAKGIELGDLGEDVPFSIEIGGRGIATRHALSGKGAKLSWKSGQPMRAVVDVQVMKVTHALGNVLLAPASGTRFSGGDGAPGVTVIDADTRVGADGTMDAEIEFTDPAVLDSLDMSAVFGAAAGFTAPPFSRVTAGDDGESQGVVFIEETRGSARTLTPGGSSVLDTVGLNGAPSGTLTVPAGAVTSDLTGVRFTPFALGVELPAPLPDAYTFVSGAEISASDDVEFVAANAPTMTLSRPVWVEKSALEEADIRLLWWDGERWIEQPGRGAYDDGTDRVGPDTASPAKVRGTGASAWAAKSAAASAKPGPAPARRVRGVVKDKNGAPLRSRIVLTRAGAMVTGADGTFEVAPSALTADSLEVVQAVGGGTSTSAVVTGGDIDDEVEVVSAVTDPPEFVLSIVSGTVYEPGGSVPSPGAEVTIAALSAFRGMTIDDRGTPNNYLDDRLSVPDLSDLGVRTFEWRLRGPTDDTEFLSSETGRTVTPIGLLIEGQGAGRPITPGAHTVRVTYQVPILGEVNLYAGFSLVVDDVTPSIVDVQLPAAVDATSAISATADGAGAYQLAPYMPLGVPVTATAVHATKPKSDVQPFQIAYTSTVDLVFPVDEDPAPPAGIPQDQWIVRAAMPAPRSRAGSEVFDGKVWVAGGRNASGTPLASMVVYDPQADAWSSRASMSAARDMASLVEAGGLLYAVGGFDGTGLLRSVEAYNPATDTWSPRRSMIGPRSDAKLAHLDGKIYACAGTSQIGVQGQDPGGALEIYDIATDTWAAGAAGPAWIGGGAAAAVNGRIYVTGDGSVSGPATMWYDPADGLWTLTNDAYLAYTRPGAAVLHGNLFRLDYYVQIYNVADDMHNKGSFPFPPSDVDWATVEVLDGVLYAAGGETPNTGPVVGDTVAYRAPWIDRTPMPTARAEHAAAAHGNLIYVGGGYDGTATLTRFEVYDTTRDLWRTKKPMPVAREGFGMAQVNGLVYAIGGRQRPSGQVLASMDVYDPATDAWTAGPPMSVARFGPAVCAINEKIYVAGGNSADLEVFDTVTRTWTLRSSMSTSRTSAAACVANGRMYVHGGYDGTNTVGSTEMYDPALDRWIARAPSGFARERFLLAAAGGKMIAVCGNDRGADGYWGVDHPYTSVYDILSDTWSAPESGPSPLFAGRGMAGASVGGKVWWIGGVSADGGGNERYRRSVRTWKPD